MCGDLNASIGRNEPAVTGPHANRKTTIIDNAHKNEQLLLGLLRRSGLKAISRMSAARATGKWSLNDKEDIKHSN